MVIVVMGPAGAGKSTIGGALAADLGWLFVDGEDQKPGLSRELHGMVERVLARREHLVLACAALTAADRATLRGDLRQVRFVHLKAPRQELEARLTRRPGHASGTSRLHRQLLEFEDPGDQAIGFDATKDPAILVPAIRRELGL